MFGNGGSSADRLNNNEQIQVSSSAELGLWKVTVTSKALLTTGNQLFSIVITSSTPRSCHHADELPVTCTNLQADYEKANF